MSTVSYDFDNMKPTHHAVVSSSISYEGLLGSNGGNNGLLCRPLQRDRDHSEGQEGIDPDMFFYFSLILSNLHQPPFLWGTLFQDSSNVL